MKRFCSHAMLATAAALLGSTALATDFFVQPLKPGPVAGTPLGVVTLQASLDATPADEDVKRKKRRAQRWYLLRRGTQSDTRTDTEGATQPADSSTNGGEGSVTIIDSSGAKWVSPRKTMTRRERRIATETPVTSGGNDTGTSASQGTEGSATQPGTTSPSAPTTGGQAPAPTPVAPSGSAPTAVTGKTWPSVGNLLASGQVKGGDRIFLLDGYHGPITIKGYKFASPVVIAPMAGAVAHVDSITVRDSSNIVFQGLKVWATSVNAGTGALIRSYPDTSNLAFIDLDVRAVPDSGNYLQWTQSEWLANQRNGLYIDGNTMTIARNRVTGIYHGIQSLADNALVEDNIVDGFSGDGLRANGDDTIVRGNKVQNCFQINGNHADGFQSFSIGANGKPGTGTVRNMTIENNKIVEWVASRSNPLRCKLQGLSMFDGMYDGFTIRNNLIVSRAYHGITMNGALNSMIVNNTVVNIDGTSDNWPWIRLSPHKNGTPSQNVTVANNLVNGNKVSTNAQRGIVETNNVIVRNHASQFVDFKGLDFGLSNPQAAGVDAGDPQYAPPKDITGASRPLGKAPDAGAYESF
ncbi:parallel beta helix pectate lyase-like protein [Albidovulum inexpectatum]|uniref:Parallel beta helix pectate lyase-like protein n=1 Tax=Albidovulum inexpectatum TaxID=196587 RepID=A0A2S5JDR7_9RHOB|nr:choice-of-anchor Q domain-containing protein [Albidovulum inexpectatum]PPB79664.1 parallel beta helix pectate lyase-like protein [Albidovulum inexpectatum]